jgi:hypothetical protein
LPEPAFFNEIGAQTLFTLLSDCLETSLLYRG